MSDGLLGVVAALEAEACTLGPAVRRRDGLSSLGDGALLAVSGMGAVLAAPAARRLVDAGVSALMSFGLAGGLDPALCAGRVVLPDEIVSVDGVRIIPSTQWRRHLRRALAPLEPVATGKLLSSARPLQSVAAKAAAFRETGAVAVDMESLAVGEVADAHGLPFIAVRVIVDGAADPVPGAVAAASRDGRLSVLRLIGGVLGAPRDIVELVRLAQRYRTATHALAAVARLRCAPMHCFDAPIA